MASVGSARRSGSLVALAALVSILIQAALVNAEAQGWNTSAPFNDPYVVCDRLTNSMYITAAAGVEQGLSEQWVAYRLSVYQDQVGWLDWDNDTEYSDWAWIHATNVAVSAWIPGIGPGGSAGSITSSVPNPVTSGSQWGPFRLAETPSTNGYAVMADYYWYPSGHTGWAWAEQVYYNGYGLNQSYWCSL